MKTIQCFALVCLLSLMLGAMLGTPAMSGDWPQWREPERNVRSLLGNPL